MSYPQPDSNQPVLDDTSNFWRLNTQLTSPGDVYESEQGALAFAIGPDSDIANIEVMYFDNGQSTRLNTLTISPDRSFVGLIGAQLTQQYPVSLRPGRILIASADLYNPLWRPDGFSGVTDGFRAIVPGLDFIQYFASVPSLIPQRSDKQYEFEEINFGGAGTGTGWIVIPAYGRKYGSFKWKNGYTTDLTITMMGVTLGISDTPGGVNSNIETPLVTTQTLVSGDTFEFVYRASVNGSFDLFAMSYDLGVVPPSLFGGTTHITVSDDAL